MCSRTGRICMHYFGGTDIKVVHARLILLSSSIHLDNRILFGARFGCLCLFALTSQARPGRRSLHPLKLRPRPNWLFLQRWNSASSCFVCLNLPASGGTRLGKHEKSKILPSHSQAAVHLIFNCWKPHCTITSGLSLLLRNSTTDGLLFSQKYS